MWIFEKLNTVEYKSPFFYEDQVELWVYDSFDKVNSFSFIQSIGNQINELANHHDNRILVLCTSYDQVKKLRDIVKPCYDYLGRKVFAQTVGHSRRAMIRGYTNSPHSILIGTMSFWEGVDFPGELVEILMIFKIPFWPTILSIVIGFCSANCRFSIKFYCIIYIPKKFSCTYSSNKATY